jgi:hypothetical protein
MRKVLSNTVVRVTSGMVLFLTLIGFTLWYYSDVLIPAINQFWSPPSYVEVAPRSSMEEIIIKHDLVSPLPMVGDVPKQVVKKPMVIERAKGKRKDHPGWMSMLCHHDVYRGNALCKK